MTNFAYLRVSTDHQDVNNQKLSVLDYCNAHGLNSFAASHGEQKARASSPW